MVQIFSALTMVCILGYFAVMIYMHKKYKEYNPIYHAVSDYGVGTSKGFYAVSGYAGALGSLSLAAALYLWAYPFPFKNMAIALLLVRALSVVGVIRFPTDVEGTEKTKHGRTHLLLAVVQFTALAVFVFNMTEAFEPVVGHNGFVFLQTLEYVVKFGLMALIAAIILPALKKYFGLFERIFLYFSALYILVCGLIVFLT